MSPKKRFLIFLTCLNSLLLSSGLELPLEPYASCYVVIVLGEHYGDYASFILISSVLNIVRGIAIITW